MGGSPMKRRQHEVVKQIAFPLLYILCTALLLLLGVYLVESR
jgi:hypothetical protein